MNRDNVKVWLAVEDGFCCGYSVCGVFASYELAKEWAAVETNDYRRIVPDDPDGYEVLAEIPDPIPYVILEMTYTPSDTDGPFREASYEDTWNWCGYYDEDTWEGYGTVPPQACTHTISPTVWAGPPYINLGVKGSDIAQCEAVYAEKRAQVIANFDLLIEAERRSQEQESV